jgi:hypothetical protein
MGLFNDTDPIPLPNRFAHIKRSLVSGNEVAITESWHRLLMALRSEIDMICPVGSDIIPTINFDQIETPIHVDRFAKELRKRGAAIIRDVIPKKEALGWKQDIMEYLENNPRTKGFPPNNPQLYELYWSPAQIKARAHPNILTAQKFAMGLWGSSNKAAQVSGQFPVTYSDRLRIRVPGDAAFSLHSHVDGGSVERWEPDGYGRSGTYHKIFQGRWEEYDPWDSSTRYTANSDLYGGAGCCTMFRMFQGSLSLSSIEPGEGSLRVCPMLQLATAYFLLRPFFTPKSTCPSAFLDDANWTLEQPQNSVLHGALPSYTQEFNSLLHPHLQLERSLVNIPPVYPGDYVIWHPDTIHAVDPIHQGQHDSSVLYIPACPLTQTNALFMTRQRKAFLLGYPGPDFESGKGEANHMGRPGVGDINEAGGDEGLKAMGLLPWEEDEAETDTERKLVGMANAILFPDRFGML